MAKAKSRKKVQIPPLLVDAVKNRRVILFLGAGSAKESSNAAGGRPPDANQLRDILAQKFFNKEMKNRDVMAVAEMAASISGGRPQVFEAVRQAFDSFQPGEAHRLLPTFQWKMIATTNYDLLIERTYSGTNDKLQSIVRFVKDDELIEEKMQAVSNPVTYIKLHGCFDHLYDNDIPLVLSREHYETYAQNRKRLFGRLQDAAREFPIVFVGYRLDDAHIRSLIYSLAGDKRPRWYIVTPDAEEIDIQFWGTKNIEVIVSKFGDFIKQLDKDVLPLWRKLSPTDDVSTFPLRKFYVGNTEESDGVRLALDKDLILVHPGMSAAAQTAKQFYEGYDTGWGGILQKFDVRRRKEEDLLFKALLENENPKSTVLLMLRGAAGAGKTIALKRTAYEAAASSNELVLWLKDNGALKLDVFQEIFDLCKRTIFLIIDQVAIHVDKLTKFMTGANRKSLPIVIIGAERDSDWNTYCSSLNALYKPQFVRLGNLSRNEIVGLLDLLAFHDCLGLLKEKTKTEQIQAFEEKERADRQLLVALHELTLGKPFEEIVLDEHRRVYPEEARQLYLDIATLHQFSVKARAGTISRISGIDFEDYKDRFVAPLQDIVKADGNEYTEDYYYQTRHARVANIVFKQVCSDDAAKSRQFLRMMAGLDVGYSTDLRALEDMTRGWQLTETFSSVEEARKIYKLAVDIAPKQAFIYQQWAIFESTHKSGSLYDAETIAEAAHNLAKESKAIIHTQAEIDRKRANVESSPLLKQSLRRRARIRLDTLPVGDRFAVSSRCKILVDEIAELSETLTHNTEDHEASEFAEKIKIAELAIKRAQQLHPDDADIIQIEARFRRELDQKDLALRALERALKAGPRGSSTAIRVAQQYDARGKNGEAHKVLRDALQKMPDDKAIHQALALHYIGLPTYSNDVVEDHLRRSFSVGDQNFEERFNLAQFLYLRGEVQRSADLFVQINATAPENFRRTATRKDSMFTKKLGRISGTIDRIWENYTFIKSPHYPKDVFGHRDLSDPDIFDDLSIGMVVSFDIRFNRHGLNAVDLRIER